MKKIVTKFAEKVKKFYTQDGRELSVEAHWIMSVGLAVGIVIVATYVAWWGWPFLNWLWSLFN